MKRLEIITNRHFNTHPVWHLVHEWEDGFSSALAIPIKKRRLFCVFMKVVFQLGRLRLPINLNRLYERLDDLYLRYFTDAIVLRVDMYPRSGNCLGSRARDVIPYIIDFDKNVSLPDFAAIYGEHRLVLISSLNALRFVAESQPGVRLGHLPLSLPDRFQLTRDVYFKRREFDLILPGRPNKLMLSWVETIAASRPEFEYLTYRSIDDRHVYVSNKGQQVDCRTRQAYFDLLQNANVAVYSTQGVDGNAKSFDHITAKLFEGVSAGCRMVGMYPETEESTAFRVGDVCPSVQTYDDFKSVVLRYISSPRDEKEFGKSIEFLSRNRTSGRAGLLAAAVRSSGIIELDGPVPRPE